MSKLQKKEWGVSLRDFVDIHSNCFIEGDIFTRFSNYPVRIGGGGYIMLTYNNQSAYIHRLTLVTTCQVDHIDRNKLNNLRSNLREATQSQNMMNSSARSDNTSGYRGVNFYKRDKKWRAYINIEGINVHLGYFFTKEEAALVYNEAAIKYFGVYANLNKVVI